MIPFNYESIYARVAVRSTAREALFIPKTFAVWGRKAYGTTPEMSTWTAYQWIAAFLHDMTGIQWIVNDDSFDLAEMPCHKAQTPLIPHEHTTDDPPMRMLPWVEDLIKGNITGVSMLHFIDRTITPSPQAPYIVQR